MAFRPGYPPMGGAPPFGGFHPPPQIFFNPMINRNFNPQQQPPPVKTTPVTTVFVGNISEKCTNDFMQQMLQECGVVTSWKRIKGSNGKYQAFGFCDYENPEGTLRALRVLNDFQIGDKKLVVKAEDKVRDDLRAWAIQQRKDDGKPALTLKENELPADEDDLKKDEDVRLKILNWIETDHPQLLTLAEDGELSDKEASKSKKEEARRKDDDSRSKDERRRRRSRSRSRTKSRNERRRGRSRTPKRRRHRSSSGSSRSSSGSSGSSSESSRSRSRSETPRHKKRKEKSVSRSRDSEDSDDMRERKKLKRQLKEKEMAYTNRLKKWEKREREAAKIYEREERKAKDRKKNILKEAKKLKHFLEDYDDEKDDPKYYKSSSLFQRKREFEREREADQKDRLREQAEIEELKKQILAENKDAENAEEEAKKRHQQQEEAALRRLRADSGSPNPHQPLGHRDGEEDSSSSSGGEDSEEEPETRSLIEQAAKENGNGNAAVSASGSATMTPQTPPVTADRWKSVTESSASPVILPAAVKVGSPANVAKRDLNQRLNGVFGLDDDEDASSRKRLRPFEITKEERMAALTEDEKRKMIKDLINNIPTSKEDLFAYKIDWDYVDKTMIDQRVRPWVGKKISEFLGEEEQALCDFICEKVTSRTDPEAILSDVKMILDDDAEVFVVKMWRLLIYESEAKKIGLPKIAK